MSEARDVSSGIDTFVPKGKTGWALISIIATVVGLLGVIGIVQSAIVPFFGLKIAEFGSHTLAVEHIAYIVSLLLSIAGFIFILTYLLWKLEETHSRLTSVRDKYVALVSESSPVFQELRSHSYVLANISKVASLTKELLDAGGVELSSPNERDRILRTILSDIQGVFDRITDDSCSVCVKVLVPDSDNRILLTTWLRDSRGAPNRRYVDGLQGTESYDAYANTAFREIIDARSGKRHFICNDLKKLAAQGKYQNANPNWSEHYNAALVVPMARESEAIKGYLGFLCVDNMRGNFDTNVGLPILNTYSSILQILLLLDIIEKEQNPSSIEVSNDEKTEDVAPQTGNSGRRRKSPSGRGGKAG